jgi:large repetitive protein
MLAGIGAGCPTSPSPDAATEVKDLGAAPIRVNAGGPSFVDSNGNTWLADTNYNTGVTYSVTDPINGAPDGQPYQSERWDRPSGSELMYSFILEPNDYLVRIHFAEIWHGTSNVGDRYFDVLIEGQQVLDNFDIVEAYGYFTAGFEEFPVTLTDGTLNIQFIHEFENPKLAGIEIELAPTADAVLDASPSSLNFGDLQVGAVSSGQTVTLTNTGTETLSISGVSVTGTNAADFATDAAVTYDIDPGLSAAFDVTFGPTGSGCAPRPYPLRPTASTALPPFP